MKVAERKQMLLLGLRPDGLIETATARTVAVSAGVIRIVLPAAPIALGDMSAEARGATGGDMSRSLALLG